MRIISKFQYIRASHLEIIADLYDRSFTPRLNNQ